MRIKAIKLFKTPLDSNYENVFDDYQTTTDYSAFLVKNFVSLNLTTPLRSTRESNGIIKVKLQRSYDEILDYNYAEVMVNVLNENGSYKNEDGTDYVIPQYYFVTDIQSLNDITNISVSELTLKFDSWANNYVGNISVQNKNNFLARCHTNNFPNFDPEQELGAKVYNQGYDDFDFSGLDTNEVHLSDGVLFLQVRLAHSAIIKNKGNTSQYNASVEFQDTTPIVYIPLYTAGSNKIYDRDGDQWNTDKIATDLRLCSVPYWLNSSDVLSVCLTYYAMKAKTGTDGSKTFNGYIWHVEVNGYDYSEENMAIFVADNNYKTFQGMTISDKTPIYTYSGEFAENALLYNPELSENSYSDDYNVNRFYFEQFHGYPFVRKLLLLNGNLTSIKPTYKKYSLNIDINKTNSTSIKVTVTVNGNTYLTQIVQPQLYLPLSVEQIDLYLRNNGTQIGTNIALNIIGNELSRTQGMLSAAGQVVSGNVIGGATTAFNAQTNASFNISSTIVGEIAKQQDIKNMLANYSIPSIIGSDTEYFDEIILFDGIVKDEEVLKAAFYDYQYYGNYYRLLGKVQDNCRYLFDYAETLNCSLPCISNLRERNEIERAFNKGLTKWHITSSCTDALRTFNKDYTNTVKI